MDIPVDADVYCNNRVCGRCTHIVLNPVTEQVTHVVVQEKRLPQAERLVPIDHVIETNPQLIRLRCSEDELANMEEFAQTQFIPSTIPSYTGMSYTMWPYAIHEPIIVPVRHEHIPPGELAVRRGAWVEAADGHVGQVDEFLVDPASGHITHLVLCEGHLWGQKDVTIPVSQIDHIEEDTVYLKLDKQRIEALPTVPVRRRW
jgi:sporulation protein YlmC with PRC-barrel domain